MEDSKSGFSLRHVFFVGLVLVLALSSFELSDTESMGITGQAMGVTVDIGQTSPAMDLTIPQGLEIRVTTPTVSFVPISTLSELANVIETTRNRAVRTESLLRFRTMVSQLPEGVNRSFYEDELKRLDRR